MSEAIGVAIRELERAEEKTGSRQGHRWNAQAIAALQAKCFHRLRKTDVMPGYRYKCQDCGKFLKILSGILMDPK